MIVFLRDERFLIGSEMGEENKLSILCDTSTTFHLLCGKFANIGCKQKMLENQCDCIVRIFGL